MTYEYEINLTIELFNESQLYGANKFASALSPLYGGRQMHTRNQNVVPLFANEPTIAANTMTRDISSWNSFAYRGAESTARYCYDESTIIPFFYLKGRKKA